MGQPLAVIRYRTKTLETLFKQKENNQALIDSCLQSIADQGDKAARILQKVRNYAKGETSRNKTVRFDLVVETAWGDLKRSGKLTSNILLRLKPVEVEGDELELGLAVFNILKNAAEALEDNPKGKIEVKLDIHPERVKFICENAGKEVAEATLQEHMTPMSTSKKEGIGLGLIIINSIAEGHGGSFSISPREGGGAIAVLDLPRHQPKAEGSFDSSGPSAA